MKKILCFVLLLHSLSLFAQDHSFSPFPSKLKLYKSGLEIIMTWQDSDDLEDESYLIYRNREPITENTFNNSQLLAEIDSGIMIFTDKPSGFGDFYYAIICRDAQRTYPVFLPYRNSSAKPVNIASREFQEENAGLVRNLQTQIYDSRVSIRFNSDQDTRRYAVYRSTHPIKDLMELNRSNLLRILEPGIRQYQDSPIPGIPYYYAVVDYELYQSSDKDLLYNGNWTNNAITLPLTEYLGSSYRTTDLRRAPLPEIRLERFFAELPEVDLQIPSEKSISPSVLGKIRNYLKIEEQQIQELEPVILAFERSESSLPQQKRLTELIEQDFNEGNWEEAQNKLLLLLQEDGGRELNHRIYFYRGQCNYFLKRYEEAYMDFSLSSRVYPRESMVWQEKIISKLP